MAKTAPIKVVIQYAAMAEGKPGSLGKAFIAAAKLTESTQTVVVRA